MVPRVAGGGVGAPEAAGVSRRGDHRALIRAALRAGCRLVRQGRHTVLRTPTGERVVTAGTPSDVNAVRNLRRDLERAGVTLS